MKTRVLIASAFALAGFVSAAQALTFVNSDDQAYTVTVTPKGGAVQAVTVEPKGKAEADCSAGCDIAMNAETASVDGKAAQITIKDGKLVTN